MLTPLPYSPKLSPYLAALASHHGLLVRYSQHNPARPGRCFIMAEPLSWLTPQAGDGLTSILNKQQAQAGKVTSGSANRTLPAADEPPCSAIAGVMGYPNSKPMHSSALANQPCYPEFCLGDYRWVITIDHASRQSWLGSEQPPSTDFVKRLQAIETASKDAACIKATDKHAANTANVAISKAGGFSLTSAFSARLSYAQYRSAFDRIQQYLRAGDCYQVNFSQLFSARFKGNPLQAFVFLQARHPAPFAAYFDSPFGQVISLSPERFVQTQGCAAQSWPIKGTRARGTDAASDEQLKQELANSAKDRAENLMIVDLLRNDFGKVCQPGSIKAAPLFEIESHPNVHHLVSQVHGQMAQPQDSLALLQACFPGGSITGAPKQRAMQIIEELETQPRAVYCGALCFLEPNYNLDSSILIRTLLCQENAIYCWGGGGIVADSNAESEYQESLDKVQVFMDSLEEEFY